MSLRDLVPGWWGKREVAPQRDSVTDPFDALRREMDRAFANFWHAVESGSMVSRTGPGGDLTAPRAEVAERDGHITVAVELPGVCEEDIEVSIASGLLTIRAEKKAERENSTAGFRYSERSYGLFQRSIPLPAGADLEKAKAEFKNGVLCVTIPTSAVPEREIKKIAVQKAA